MANVFESLSSKASSKRSVEASEAISDERIRKLSTEIVDVAALNSFTIPKAKKKKGGFFSTYFAIAKILI